MKPDTISSDLLLVVADATLYHFGVLSSAMHMAWVRQVCGRLESRYRYSAKLVYNNYPWPLSPSGPQRGAVETAAQEVLDLRVAFGDGRAGFLPTRKPSVDAATLADLYDPLAMPLALRKAHHELDRAVDRCYGIRPLTNDRQRVEFLFGLYEQLAAPLLPQTKARHTRSG